MKNSLTLAATLIILSCSFCLARLGETEAQCESRYGKPTSVGKPDKSGEQLNMYRAAGIEIVIWFIEGRAECLKFDSGTLSQEEPMQALLTANAQGHSWRPIEPWGAWTMRWSRDDGARARMRPGPGSATFVIESKAFIERQAEKDNPGLKRF